MKLNDNIRYLLLSVLLITIFVYIIYNKTIYINDPINTKSINLINKNNNNSLEISKAKYNYADVNEDAISLASFESRTEDKDSEGVFFR